jgi:hypothetical protein
VRREAGALGQIVEGEPKRQAATANLRSEAHIRERDREVTSR